MSLDFEPARLQAWIERAGEGIGRLYAERESRSVLTPTSPAAVQARFEEPLPEDATDVERLLETVETDVFDHCNLNVGPHFYGYITGGGNHAGILAEMYKAALNQNNLKWHSSPSSTELERLVCRWVAEFVGFPSDGAGVLLGGGSVANFECLAVARKLRAPLDISREGLSGAPPMTVYVSSEGHSSFDKAVDVLGLGQDQLRKIPVDSDFRVRVDELAAHIERDRREGCHPLCVVGIAGTTNTGAVDDLHALADLAQREGLWYHVDAAYGGPAAKLDGMAPLFRGIERADSLVVNPHKWMYVPFGAACVLVRDAGHLRRTFGTAADYLRSDQGQDDRTDLMEYNLPLTKEFRALKVWMTLKAHGARRIREAIANDVALAQRLAERVDASADFERLAPAPLSIVCFRHVRADRSDEALDELNRRILVELEHRGKVFLTGTRVRGHTALRVCMINHRREPRHVDELFDHVAEVSRSIDLS